LQSLAAVVLVSAANEASPAGCWMHCNIVITHRNIVYFPGRSAYARHPLYGYAAALNKSVAVGNIILCTPASLAVHARRQSVARRLQPFAAAKICGQTCIH